MPPTMSMRESRERAERVYLLRSVLGLSWRSIRDAEGFTSVGGAQRAYERHRARNPLPDAKTVAPEILERKRFATGKAAAALVMTNDPHEVAELARVINAQDVELAKMYGLTSEAVDVNVKVVQRSPTEILDDYKRELLASIDEALDAEVIEIEQ